MRTHNSSSKIHDRKLHILLTMEAFSRTVIIYEFQLKLINGTKFQFTSILVVFTSIIFTKTEER